MNRGLRMQMELNGVKSYRDPDISEMASAVAEVHRVTEPFPRREPLAIVAQLRRAAYSIPAGIAEGFGRSSTKEPIQLLSVANASLEEFPYFLELSQDPRYRSPIDREKVDGLKSISQMIAAVGRSLKRRLAEDLASSIFRRCAHRGNTEPRTWNTRNTGVTH